MLGHTCHRVKHTQDCPLCWYVLHQMLARPHQQPSAFVKFHNLASWRKKIQKNPSSSVLSQILCPGRTCPSGTHSDRSNGPEIENLLWKAHTLSLIGFMKKIWALSFYGLCSMEIAEGCWCGLANIWCQTYQHTLFWAEWQTIWYTITHLSIGVDGRVLAGRQLEPIWRCISTFDALCSVHLCL